VDPERAAIVGQAWRSSSPQGLTQVREHKQLMGQPPWRKWCAAYPAAQATGKRRWNVRAGSPSRQVWPGLAPVRCDRAGARPAGPELLGQPGWQAQPVLVVEREDARLISS